MLEATITIITSSPYWQPLIQGAGILGLIFLLTWGAARYINNYGVVDVVWGFSLVGMAFWLASALWQENIWLPRLILMASLVTLEYGRLGIYIAQRFFKEYPEEDSRYAACREAWGTRAHTIMLLAYLLQAVLIFAMLLPVAWVAANPSAGFSILEWIGIGIWACGFSIEVVADKQLKAFKSNSENKGKLCRVGLWSISRHPNYFGQWLEWLGIAVMALAQPYGWSMLYIVVLMYLFLTKVTGISITEEAMAKKYGKQFSQYQKETSSFIPKFI